MKKTTDIAPPQEAKPELNALGQPIPAWRESLLYRVFVLGHPAKL